MTARVRRPPQSASRSPLVAMLLTFLLPGLGHVYLSRPRAAAAWALPAVAVPIVLLVAARDGLDVLAVRMFSPTTSLTVVLLAVLLAGWRIASMGHVLVGVHGNVSAAGSHVRRPGTVWGQPRVRRAFAVLAVVVILTHGLLAWIGLAFYRAGSDIFVPPDRPGTGTGTNPSPTPAGPAVTPYATPNPAGWLNVMLVGADSGLGYDHSLTDTMMVVSVHQQTNDVVMVSFPRDIAGFPLYTGGTFSPRLNSLMTHALSNPEAFPDGGVGTLSRQLGYLLGVPIHHYAFVNLAGFKSMIDAVGGVSVVNERAIRDPGYGFPDGEHGFFLSAGPHHLDGRTALAYVRSRNSIGDNDFTRARRQQQLLLALRAKMTDPALLPRLPAILDAAAETIETDYPVDRASDLLQLAKGVDGDNVEQVVLGPPYAERGPSSTTYFLRLNMDKVRELSLRVYGEESAYYTGPSAAP